MHAASALLAANNGSSAISFLFLPLIFVAMYFLMIRPQRRRQRESASLQQSIEVGDEIMTTSGVYGFVTGFEGDVAWLEIDDNVQIRVSRAAIQRRVDSVVDVDTDAGVPGTSTEPTGQPVKSRHTKISDSINDVGADPIDGETTK